MSNSTTVPITLESLRRIPSPKATTLLNWCDEHCDVSPALVPAPQGSGKNGFEVVFLNEKDAIMFGLKWL